MQIHEIKRKNPNKKKKTVGRGGTRGKTSGRGMKGQKSRAGHSIRPEMRDIIKKIPKLRGYGTNRSRTVNTSRPQPQSVTLSRLNEMFEIGSTVSPVELVEKNIVKREKGRLPLVKVVARGGLTKKLTISHCTFSPKAKEAVIKAGGTINE